MSLALMTQGELPVVSWAAKHASSSSLSSVLLLPCWL